MDLIIIAIVCLLAAGLTFFSGFGLGTILLPVFALFFPITTAIAATAIVHFANNAFKFGMIYKDIHWKTALLFGFPAIGAAFIGSWTLVQLGKPNEIVTYSLFNQTFTITGLKIVIGVLLIFFAFFELNKRLSEYTFPPKYLSIGGLLSGFFGGLSGHQGAFRSAFLAKSGMDKNQFIATSSSIALMIDITRLIIYSKSLQFVLENKDNTLIYCGMIFAFIGSYFGKKLPGQNFS